MMLNQFIKIQTLLQIITNSFKKLDVFKNQELFTLQALLGHSTLKMVQTYARVVEIDIKQAHQRASHKTTFSNIKLSHNNYGEFIFLTTSRGKGDSLVFMILFIILLFYTFIIDILVLVKWHPDFLNLPEKEAFTNAVYHLKTLIPGTIYSLIVSLSVTLFSWIFIIQ